MSIRFKLTFLLILLFFAAIMNSLFIMKMESLSEKRSDSINHTNDVLLTAEKLLGDLKDAETGQRGYVLSGNPAYLKPYYDGTESLANHYSRLTSLTSDDPEQQELLRKIKKIVAAKIKELASTINSVQEGHKDAAIEMINRDIGKDYMDDIRSLIAEFSRSELVLLEKRKGEFMQTRAEINTIIIVEILFMLVLAIVTFLFLNKTFFLPLQLLISGAKKVEEGRRLDVQDIISKDEMGQLLATFYAMSEKVYSRSRRLTYDVNHDTLTGLKNRKTLYESIENSIRAARQSNCKVAALFIDLNMFKQINDTLGHDAGDLILQETAERICSAVRSDDEIFRVGGDEFLVILQNIASSEDVHGIIQKILEAFAVPVEISGSRMTIQISIGIALLPDDTRDGQELVKFADVAMYAAKNAENTDYKMFERSMLQRIGDLIINNDPT